MATKRSKIFEEWAKLFDPKAKSFAGKVVTGDWGYELYHTQWLWQTWLARVPTNYLRQAILATEPFPVLQQWWSNDTCPHTKPTDDLVERHGDWRIVSLVKVGR